jgi:type I restriction-modification system DNA methylase subunit
LAYAVTYRDARKSRSRFAQWLFKADDSSHTAAEFYTNRTVVRAYQDFKDEPGFTRVVPIEEIRAKEGNLSIPLYVVGETQAQTDSATEKATMALPVALAAWLESSAAVRQSFQSLLVAEK